MSIIKSEPAASATSDLIMLLFESFLHGNSVKARVVRGTFWSLVATASIQITSLVSSILAARILGQTGFGELGMIRSTVLMFGVLAGTGLGMAATKYVAEYRDANSVRVGRLIGLLTNAALVLGGMAVLICLLLAAPLAQWVMNAPHLTDSLRIGCLLLLLNTINGVQLGILGGFEAFRAQSWVTILDGFLNLTLIPAGAWFLGVTGAVVGTVLAAAVGFPIKQWVARRECLRAGVAITYRGVLGEIPILWKFALPAVLVGISTQPFEWLIRLMLVRQPNGFAELGVFTAVYSWAQLIIFIPGMISGPSMPIMANLLAGRQVTQLKRLVVRSQVLISFLALSTAVLLATLSPYLLRIYGTGFISGRVALLTMMAAYVICTATLITRSLFAASGAMWWQAAHTALWGVLLVIGCIFLVPYGVLGLALSYLAAYAVFTSLQLGTQVIVLNRYIARRD